ncbi:MAG: DNA polymerase III subunit epsilon [Rhodospirillaceae bacterium]|nr:DNA polymerase III subunit epsilon [Rhodospirillaceae bacterium]
MREIVLDTETTGLDPKSGNRIVEIGCVEMVNQIATGETYHTYINPERDMPEQAFAVHGLSEEFLSGHPVFADVAEAFLAFIDDSTLVIHNAEFDMGFVNAELARLDLAPVPMDRAVDTVRIARRKFPGAPANLDALCRRFQIDNSNRELHGALLDARLLADVYLELTGGRQRGLSLAGPDKDTSLGGADMETTARPPRDHHASAQELTAHEAFIERLEEPVWKT